MNQCAGSLYFLWAMASVKSLLGAWSKAASGGGWAPSEPGATASSTAEERSTPRRVRKGLERKWGLNGVLKGALDFSIWRWKENALGNTNIYIVPRHCPGHIMFQLDAAEALCNKKMEGGSGPRAKAGNGYSDHMRKNSDQGVGSSVGETW